MDISRRVRREAVVLQREETFDGSETQDVTRAKLRLLNPAPVDGGTVLAPQIRDRHSRTYAMNPRMLPRKATVREEDVVFRRAPDRRCAVMDLKNLFAGEASI